MIVHHRRLACHRTLQTRPEIHPGSPARRPRRHRPARAALTARTVLQVLPALVSGGVERGTLEIAEALVGAGWRALVASAGGPLRILDVAAQVGPAVRELLTR